MPVYYVSVDPSNVRAVTSGQVVEVDLNCVKNFGDCIQGNTPSLEETYVIEFSYPKDLDFFVIHSINPSSIDKMFVYSSRAQRCLHQLLNNLLGNKIHIQTSRYPSAQEFEELKQQNMPSKLTRRRSSDDGDLPLEGGKRRRCNASFTEENIEDLNDILKAEKKKEHLNHLNQILSEPVKVLVDCSQSLSPKNKSELIDPEEVIVPRTPDSQLGKQSLSQTSEQEPPCGQRNPSLSSEELVSSQPVEEEVEPAVFIVEHLSQMRLHQDSNLNLKLPLPSSGSSIEQEGESDAKSPLVLRNIHASTSQKSLSQGKGDASLNKSSVPSNGVVSENEINGRSPHNSSFY